MNTTTSIAASLTLLALLALAACQATEGSETESDSAPTAAAVGIEPGAEPMPTDPYERALLVSLEATAPIEGSGLHNIFHLGENIISGSEPHGEKAYEELAAMGVKTIVTVDGKTPEVEAAHRHGMRYVHVPIEYRGIPQDTIAKLTKTFRELEGPFYVHCFHGKHRGPAAAAVGRLALDGISRDQALAEMRQWCGTAKKYSGLYQTIAEMELPSPEASKALDWDFPEKLELDGFRAVMIEAVRARDNLKMLAKRDWEPDPNHPDVALLNEADKMLDLFSASAEMEEVKGEDEDFRGWVQSSVVASRALQAAARDLRKKPQDPQIKLRATQAFDQILADCSACHKAYRD